MNFVKQTIAILLLLILFSGIGIKSFITFNYFINKAEITVLFCINKEKPQLQCDGKCHLAQELKKVDANQEDEPYIPSQKITNYELTFIVANANLTLQHNALTTLNNQQKTNNEKLINPYFSVVTPPPKQWL